MQKPLADQPSLSLRAAVLAITIAALAAIAPTQTLADEVGYGDVHLAAAGSVPWMGSPGMRPSAIASNALGTTGLPSL